MFPEKYILLGERALANTARLYEKTHSCPCVLDSLIIRDIVSGIKTPLQLKVNTRLSLVILASYWSLSSVQVHQAVQLEDRD